MQELQRKEQILLDIVADYIERVRPVSSGELLAHYKYPVSSATVRNIMLELNEAGFLYQPHTSAGRVPTEKAYRFFIDKMDLMPASERKAAYNKLKRDMQGIAVSSVPDELSQFLARRVAELTGSLAFAGMLGVPHIYKEGLLRILEEPEFSEPSTIRNFLTYTENLQSCVNELYRRVHDEVYIAVGALSAPEQYPFSMMAFTYHLPNRDKRGFVGIAGPMRMHYRQNLTLLDSIKNLFDDLYE